MSAPAPATVATATDDAPSRYAWWRLVAALMLGISPRLTSAQIQGIMLSTSRPLAGHEFAWLEGFREVVIGPQLKSYDSICHFSARGQHDDRNMAGLTNSAAHGKTIHVGKHNV